MYLLFKSVSQRDQGIIQTVGRWSNYTVGYLPDTHKDLIDYRAFNPRVLPEEVAQGWMFMDAWEGQISVRVETPQNEALQVLSSEEELGTKTKYTLTDEQVANTVQFYKELMRLTLDEVYDKRMLELNIEVSALEQSSWEQQRVEAQAGGGPLLQALAEARGITEAEMITKVLEAVAAYNQSVTDLLAAKQSVEAEIKTCTTIRDCTRLMHQRFETSMAQAQADEEGITTPATFNL